MPAVTIRVPASTSNLGPGYDCLGVALRLYNDITVTRGRGKTVPPMVAAAAEKFFARAAVAPFAFRVRITGEVPMARGLGSSVTVRLGTIHGLNQLAGGPLARAEIFALCAELEGHPDNAAPATFGGFNVVSGADPQRFPVAAALKFILLIPDFEVSTAKARALLPAKISRQDAVESCGHAAAITAAFASGKYANLRGAFRDGLHQPFRKPLVPFFDQVVAAAENAGALGAFLSGSGSTIAAVSLGQAQKIADAMSAAAGEGARTIITTADNGGARQIRNP